MLIYVGRGTRRYGDFPVAPVRRRAWEFQAVLRGRAAPLFTDGASRLRTRTLWLFSPETPHGWTGEKGREAEVAVFHHLSLPEPLLGLARSRPSPLEIPLGEASVRRLRQLARGAWSHWQSPSPSSILALEHVLLEISLLVYEASAGDEAGSSEETAAWRTVRRTMEVFSSRMAENPSQTDLARGAGVSVSHLRRLFHEALRISPKQALDQLRFQRATQLMGDPGAKLESVAEACGFGSASAFSRAFRLYFGCSPSAWRG